MKRRNTKRTLTFLLIINVCFTFLHAQAYQDSISSIIVKYAREQAPILRQNTLTLDSFRIDKRRMVARIYMNKFLESVPFRESGVIKLKKNIQKALPPEYKKYKIEIYVSEYEIEDLIPNLLRSELAIDKSRMFHSQTSQPNFVRNLSKKSTPQNGLQNNTIALWASHGWYFEQRQDEWVWQRPRMFHVAEDTYTLGYVLPYLAPMLENAGAYVLMPRERDTQLHEKIVDNDDDAFPYYEEIPDAKNDWQQGDTTGFGHRKEMYVSGENPFCFGTYRQIKAKKDGIAAINWTPDIPEDGEYSVYVSYHSLPNSTSDARYTVYHTGGFTEFSVNQKMGGSMWVYLGSFHFRKGVNPETGRVVLTNHGKSNTIVSADAVRFGGGYGLIGRSVSEDEEPTTGLKPKYLEGARYWLQWAGFPDSVYARNENHDYKDDYMSRGHWVNALIGGSTLAPDTDGKKIPISLAMGFHTDAGQVFKDSVIGTMSIYMSQSNNSKSFTNGQRRIVSRDLADIVQTEIVSDARRMFRENWTRRKLTDASYYEARVPEVPTFLLELLSHQNYTDMTYGLDPNFQFHICRSIYKGILKFMAFQQDRDYIVQPLPVCNFNIQFFNDERNVLLLNWSPTEDSLETTAKADHYLLYTSVDDNGWNNGEIIQGTSARITLLPDKLYRFKITAVNKGGESFPSEILAAGLSSQSTKTALVINGFHRVSAPEGFDTPEYSGFLDTDMGVPDKYDLSYTGRQYNFLKKSKYKGNNSPGHGGSESLFENDKIAGNTFDFPAIHGKAILAAGYSFVSCSNEVIQEGRCQLNNYNFIDLILGEEKSTKVGYQTRHQLFQEPMRKVLRKYLVNHKGHLYASGAYIASDLYERDSCDYEAINFAETILKYKLNDHEHHANAVVSNYFSPWKCFGQKYYRYNDKLNAAQYAVEAPDAIESINGSRTIHSFEGDNLGATIGYSGKYKTVISSIPFESIVDEGDRENLMSEIIRFFETK